MEGVALTVMVVVGDVDVDDENRLKRAFLVTVPAFDSLVFGISLAHILVACYDSGPEEPVVTIHTF